MNQGSNFLSNLFDRLPPFDKWLKSLLPGHKISKRSLLRVWNNVSQFRDKLEIVLNNSDLSEYSKNASGLTRNLAEMIIQQLPNIVNSVTADCFCVHHVGLILLYPQEQEATGILVDDVLLSDSKDCTKFWDKMLLTEKQKEDGRDIKSRMMDHVSKGLINFDKASPVADLVKPFVLYCKHEGDLQATHCSKYGKHYFAVPFRSGSCLLNAVLFVVTKRKSPDSLPSLIGILLCCLQLIEESVNYEMVQLFELISTHQAKLKNTSLAQRKEIIDTVKEVHGLWPAQEISINRKSGPFVIWHNDLSLIDGEECQDSSIKPYYYQILWSEKYPKHVNKKHSGFVGQAFVKQKSFYTPDVTSHSKRDGLVPANEYDDAVKEVCSQYTTPISYRREFSGVVNVGFSERKAGMWHYQRRILDHFLEVLADQLDEYFREKSNTNEHYRYDLAVQNLRNMVGLEKEEKSSQDIREYFIDRIELLRDQYRIRSFAPVKPHATKLTEILLPILDRYRKGFSKEIEISDQFLDDPILLIPREQLELVFENLLSNAIESSSKGQNAEVNVRIQFKNGRTAWKYPSKQNGVEIGIFDTGDPVPQWILMEMFDRGFSTKKDSAHLGLGLWYVDQVCREHGYSIEYRTKVTEPFQKGFCILLPHESTDDAGKAQ